MCVFAAKGRQFVDQICHCGLQFDSAFPLTCWLPLEQRERSSHYRHACVRNLDYDLILDTAQHCAAELHYNNINYTINKEFRNRNDDVKGY